MHENGNIYLPLLDSTKNNLPLSLLYEEKFTYRCYYFFVSNGSGAKPPNCESSRKF